MHESAPLAGGAGRRLGKSGRARFHPLVAVGDGELGRQQPSPVALQWEDQNARKIDVLVAHWRDVVEDLRINIATLSPQRPRVPPAFGGYSGPNRARKLTTITYRALTRRRRARRLAAGAPKWITR